MQNMVAFNNQHRNEENMEENYGNDNNQWNGGQSGNPAGDQWNNGQGANQSNGQWNANQNGGQWNANQTVNQSGTRAGDEFQQGAGQYTQAPQEGYYVPEEPNPGMSVAGMVCGILSLVLCCCSQYISLVLALVGLGLSAYALSKDKPGRGMAIAGLVCSLVGLILSVLLIIASVMSLSYTNNMLDKYRSMYNMDL